MKKSADIICDGLCVILKNTEKTEKINYGTDLPFSYSARTLTKMLVILLKVTSVLWSEVGTNVLHEHCYVPF